VSAEVHDVRARAYAAMARDVLDHLDARGWCEVWGVPNTEGVRKAIRAEARRRNVKVSTFLMGRERDGVYVEAREPSERAQAHGKRGECAGRDTGVLVPVSRSRRERTGDARTACRCRPHPLD
jgi:hypothetical protein